MRAARVGGGTGFVDSKLFWLLVENSDEPCYLVAILNAPCLKEAFAQSRESGRDFGLHPWEKVPIPRYDNQNRHHCKLAVLCESAEEMAGQCMRESLMDNQKPGQVVLSAQIRKAVFHSDVGRKINELVAKILPDQARSS